MRYVQLSLKGSDSRGIYEMRVPVRRRKRALPGKFIAAAVMFFRKKVYFCRLNWEHQAA